MSDSEPISPRARLQQLQAIPDRQRTDAEWDELNELEIMLASGNRPGAPNPNVRSTGGSQWYVLCVSTTKPISPRASA